MIARRTFVFGHMGGWFNLDLKTGLALVWVAGIVIGMGILVAIISLIAQGALITSAAESLRQKQINLKRSWQRGVKHLGTVFIINLLRALSMTLVVVGAGYAWTLLTSNFAPALWVNIISVILLSVALFLGLSISSWSVYALCYSVLDGKGARNAIKRGWELFHRHLLVSLELNILLFIVLLLIFAVFYGAFFLSVAPALIFWLIAGITGSLKLVTVGLVVWAAFLIVAIALVGAVYNAFSTSAWTYLFLRMHNDGIASRVFHYLRKLINK
ncbi:MAG TPA: hypothetical protein VJB62_02415, partial [Patescibacteria group bacterium]|nr:hypothetical protein [Patescibacteria group bacterium]